MSVQDYLSITGKRKPEHRHGNWNVLKVVPGREYQEVMCLYWMSRECAVWFLEYYSHTYPKMRFVLIGYDP